MIEIEREVWERKIRDLKKWIDENDIDLAYDCLGIRVQDVPFPAEGEVIDHQSSQWVDGDETSNKLDGICCVDIRNDYALKNMIQGSKYMTYSGEYIALIGSGSADGGEDLGEAILGTGGDPVKVVKIIKI